MKYWKEIPIPELMKDCVINKDGLPVPYIVLESEGVYYFKINEQQKVLDCLVNRKCTICGNALNSEYWFIGGPASAFHIHGAFNDAPVHKQCGEYALKVCPYLAFARYNSKISFEKLQESLKGKFILENTTVDTDRLPLFCFIKATGYSISTSLLLKPTLPYLEIEFWNDGEKLDDTESIKIIKDLFEKKYKIQDLNL